MNSLDKIPKNLRRLAIERKFQFESNRASPYPDNWKDRVKATFPQYASKPFADRHVQFWEWVDTIENDVKPRSAVAIWPRGGGKSTSVEMAVCDLGIRGARNYVWYVCANQESADRHILTISNMLQNQTMNPKLAQPRISKTGNRNWNRQQVITDTGFAIESIGLDKALRGSKLDWSRPDLIIFDDIDQKKDSAHIIRKKIDTITTSILPAGSSTSCALFVQNLIHQNSIASMLADESETGADFMLDRMVFGPHKAIDNMVTENQYSEEYKKNIPIIVSGEATWEGQSLDVCQAQILEWGLSAFLQESQQEVKGVGEFFLREWFEIVDEAPKCDQYFRYWDYAGSQDKGDYTVGLLMGMDGGTYYVIDVLRFRKEGGDRDKIVKTTAKADLSRYRYIETWRERGTGESGKDTGRWFDSMMKDIGMTSSTELVSGSKPTRAENVKSAFQEGNVKLVSAGWNSEFIDELCNFNVDMSHPHDDQVDACSGAFNLFLKQSKPKTWVLI